MRNGSQNTAVSDETGKRSKTAVWEEDLGRQRDLYRERCIRLQKENEDLRRMLDKIQIMVCQYSNG